MKTIILIILSITLNTKIISQDKSNIPSYLKADYISSLSTITSGLIINKLTNKKKPAITMIIASLIGISTSIFTPHNIPNNIWGTLVGTTILGVTFNIDKKPKHKHYLSYNDM